MDRGAWWAIVHGVARIGRDLVTEPPQPYKIEGHVTCRVSHRLDFADCILMVQFNMFLCTWYFLKVGSWNQRFHQSHFQSIWQDYRQWCVLSSEGT